MALKRLLREIFSDQLATKGRISSLEEQAARQLEAGDVYNAFIAAGAWSGSGGNSGGGACRGLSERVKLRVTGTAHGGASLVVGEAGCSAERALQAWGAAGGAGVTLWLHSVLDDGQGAGQAAQQISGMQGGQQLQQQQEQQASLQEVEREQQQGAGLQWQRPTLTRQRLTAMLAQNAQGWRADGLYLQKVGCSMNRMLLDPLLSCAHIHQHSASSISASYVWSQSRQRGDPSQQQAGTHHAKTQAHTSMTLQMKRPNHRPFHRFLQLLYRAELGKRLRLMVAPVGGCLSDLAPGANPHAPLQYGTTPVFRHGHALRAAALGGSGGAVSWGSGGLTASAGHFCRLDPGERGKCWNLDPLIMMLCSSPRCSYCG